MREMRVKVIKTDKGNRDRLIECNVNVRNIEHVYGGLNGEKLVFTPSDGGERFKIDLKDIYYMYPIIVVKREGV